MPFGWSHDQMEQRKIKEGMGKQIVSLREGFLLSATARHALCHWWQRALKTDLSRWFSVVVGVFEAFCGGLNLQQSQKDHSVHPNLCHQFILRYADQWFKPEKARTVRMEKQNIRTGIETSASFSWYWMRRPEAAEERLEKREESYRNETEILRKPTSSLPNPCWIELDNINLDRLITDEEFLECCDWMARTAEWAGEPEIMALSRHCKKMAMTRVLEDEADLGNGHSTGGNGYGQKWLEMNLSKFLSGAIGRAWPGHTLRMDDRVKLWELINNNNNNKKKDSNNNKKKKKKNNKK
ncbi:hypothetical protein BY996DRAFT_6542630 [Phakopsora pachyrhizi]|nr:hypothetical protein BY996DRAFT_6542630 [Phakopsora pachyrhizi]